MGENGHPALNVLGGFAAIATILTFLFQFGPLDLPDFSNGSSGGGPCANASISLSRGSGPSGTGVTVSGSGFSADESVELRFHTEALPPSRVSADGKFSVQIAIPGTFDTFAPMQFEIRATSRPSLCSGSAPFQLTKR
jgi:hypothetical protein